MCHTSYITQFASRQEEQCLQQYRKQCNIIIGDVCDDGGFDDIAKDINIAFVLDVVESESTSRVCLRPLQRLCG